MNKKLIGLLMTAAVLSACSSGAVRNGAAEGLALGEGNSSGSSSSSTSSNTTTTTPTTTFNGAGLSITTYSGLDVNGENSSPSANYIAPTSDSEINILQVEGRSITLIPNDQLSNKTWHETANKALYTGATAQDSWSIIGNQLQYAKFGEVYDAEEKRFRFAQGNATPESAVPTTGTVNYSGYATHGYGSERYAEKPTKGTSEFTVNFGEKTVVGAIKPVTVGDFEQIDLKAVVSGNKFEGYNTTTGTSQGAVVSGVFYGPNAEEVAGTFNFSGDGTINGSDQSINGQKPMGTFGATKQ